MFICVRRKIYDEYNDEEVELTPHETKLIRKLLKGQAPHANFDPYAVCNFSFILWSPFLVLIICLNWECETASSFLLCVPHLLLGRFFEVNRAVNAALC